MSLGTHLKSSYTSGIEMFNIIEGEGNDKSRGVKDLDKDPFDRLLYGEPEVGENKEVKPEKPKKRKRGPPREGFQRYSLYMEPEMWADMKWLSRRLEVGSRSALVRLLISRLRDRVRKVDQEAKERLVRNDEKA